MKWWSAWNDTAHPWPQDIRKAFYLIDVSYFVPLSHVSEVFLVKN